MVGLGDLPGGTLDSWAYRVSAGGSIIVGQATSASGSEAFRWTQAGGLVGLGDLPGGDYESMALDVSEDGSIVVGSSQTDAGVEAFIWDGSNGIRSLQDLLTAHGEDLTGWQLDEALGLSADGRFIVGTGINPEGYVEAWLAGVPEPSAWVLFGLGVLGLAAAEWRKRRLNV
jgi:probable HAF family extracellular repeat protein